MMIALFYTVELVSVHFCYCKMLRVHLCVAVEDYFHFSVTNNILTIIVYIANIAL